MVTISKDHQQVEMKRSKSSHPILEPRSSQTVVRQRSFIADKDKQKHFSRYNSEPYETKLDKVLLDAEESYQRGEFEDALIKFTQGATVKPKSEAFTLGVRKSRLAILNDFKNSGDNYLVKKKNDIRLYDGTSIEDIESFFNAEIKSVALKKSMQKLNIQTKPNSKRDSQDINDFKSETARSIYKNYTERSAEKLFNLKIQDGNNFKLISATTQDVKEYMKDKDYFKMKEQNAKEWKKLRSEMNKKIAEKEAIERYEKEAKFLEEKSAIRHYCEEQVQLIGRYYQNGKVQDVIRFSENFIKYLHKKPDKLLPRKWVYLATAFNYLGRAFIEQENFEKAKTFGEKLYKIAISSANTELISQSYILSGKIYVKFGKYEEAAFVWEKLIPLIENFEKKAWLFHEIGRCYFEMGKFDNSYKYGVESAEWAAKSSSELWLCCAKVLQGQSEMKRNNFLNALNIFSEAKKHAEITNDENTINYIVSIEEVLSKAINKGKDNKNKNNNNV